MTEVVQMIVSWSVPTRQRIGIDIRVSLSLREKCACLPARPHVPDTPLPRSDPAMVGLDNGDSEDVIATTMQI